MNIEVENVKGFQDFLPPESLKRDAVRKVVEKYFKLYGFSPIETPIVEFDELMKGDNLDEEDGAVSDRFRLKDRGGRNLGLRYEFTFQLARILKQNPNLKLPFRRYQIGENFRDEPIGLGRFRQFVQCDADIVGDSSIEGEAEILAMFFDILKEIDKLEKIGEDNVKANLKKYADGNQVLTLFKLMEKPIEFFIENKFDGANELEDLFDLCKKYSLKLRFNPYMVRGFGYYTGNIIEIVREGTKGSLAGGGRYDKVVGKYVGKEVPAFGLSFGLERICEFAKVKIENIPEVMVISIEEDNEAVKLVRKLRKEKISCVKTNEKVGKSMEYANSYGIQYVILLGNDEVKQGKYKLKDMNSGEEKLLSEAQLINVLK